jgi:ABC-type multidrug transport system fused ATPase/permease subunit
VFDLVVLVAALCLILTTPGITGAKAGFIMGFAQTIAAEFNQFVVCAREFDLKGVNLERLAEYRGLDTEDIPSFIEESLQDRALVSRALLIDDNWPQTGEISVQHLHARYADDLPDVLSDVTFKVEAGERIGIVGATGCGKSSLAKAFFSFVDITKGSIQIDDKGR